MGFWSSLLGTVGTAAGAALAIPTGGLSIPAGAALGGAIGSGLGGIGDASNASDDASDAADDALKAQKEAAFAKTFKPMGTEMPASSPLIQTGGVSGGGGMAPYSDDILDELERKYRRKGAA